MTYKMRRMGWPSTVVTAFTSVANEMATRSLVGASAAATAAEATLDRDTWGALCPTGRLPPKRGMLPSNESFRGDRSSFALASDCGERL